MKVKLIYNYWLILISWGLFLNDLAVLAILTSLLASLIMLINVRRINYWRNVCVFILSYIVIHYVLMRSNIPFYFEKSYAFLAAISLNMSITNEHLYLLTSKKLFPFIVIMMLSLSVLSFITYVLPDNLYSLFTKRSLYITIAFIFLPYLTSVLICLLYKKSIYYAHNKTERYKLDN